MFMTRLLLMVCLTFKLDELVIYLLLGGLIHLQLLFGLHSPADYRHFVVSGDRLKDGGAKRLGGRRVVGRLQRCTINARLKTALDRVMMRSFFPIGGGARLDDRMARLLVPHPLVDADGKSD